MAPLTTSACRAAQPPGAGAPDAWDEVVDWHLVLPPLRPSAEQLDRIRARVQGLDRSLPVGVLGSTPEFRDMLAEERFARVYVFERSAASYARMSRLRLRRSPEQLVEGDWLDGLATVRGELGLLLSDLTSGCVPYERHAELYACITTALRPAGLFIDKVLALEPPLVALDALVARYATRPLNVLYVNQFVVEAFFCSELLERLRLLDASRLRAALHAHARDSRWRAYVALSRGCLPSGAVWYYGRPWSELSRHYCPELRRVAVEPDEPASPAQRWLRHYTFVKP